MTDSDAPGTGALGRLVAVVVFTVACASIFGFLWVNSGGKVPVVGSDGYRVAVDVPRVANVVYFSDVMIAGIKVGKVTEVTEEGDHARVVMELDEDAAPLHGGAIVQVRAKSLVEESFLEITDGTGQRFDSGDTLPLGAGRAPTQLDDVLATLDEPTRNSLRATLRSMGASTLDSKQEVAAAVMGLGDLGREGRTVIDALADQSTDLRSLTRNATRVLAALSTRRAQIGALVTDAQLVSEATAGQAGELEAFIREVPPVLDSARRASGDLTRLGTALTPVATNLDAAAPDLTAALDQLPGTSTDVRAMLPALDGVLGTAPATLTKVPAFTTDVAALLPDASAVLSDLNPMLAYLEPYGKDVAAFFTNFAQTLALGDENGAAFRVMPPLNEQSYKGHPLSTNVGPLDKFNPLPSPNSLDDLGPYGDRAYPHVRQEDVDD